MNSCLRIFSFLIICLLFCAGCQRLDKKDLIGKWKVVSIEEEEQPLGIDISQMYFDFFNDGTYLYQGNLKYKEAGTFYLKKNLLYTLDTTQSTSKEKAVRISLTPADSLVFKMNNQGAERLMRLVRKNDN